MESLSRNTGQSTADAVRRIFEYRGDRACAAEEITVRAVA